MKIEEIKTIVKLMSENDLTEFKIEAEDMHLCLRRGMPAVTPSIVQAAPIAQAAPVIAAVPAPAAPAVVAAAAAPAAKAPIDKSKIIESPIVGTFYRAGSPGAESFAKIGMKVVPETVVCIVEAMKVMNEIKSEKTGVIKEILAENGQPVEFGQPLFILE